jgi:hypothetical protein
MSDVSWKPARILTVTMVGLPLWATEFTMALVHAYSRSGVLSRLHQGCTAGKATPRQVNMDLVTALMLIDSHADVVLAADSH